MRGAEHIARAAELLDRSIRLDPEFGAAHLALAQVVALEQFYTDKSVPQQFTLARQHLATALEVEPALQHEAQALEGFKLLRSRDWLGAQAILQATLAAAPDDALAHYFYAMFLAAIGDYSVARMHAQQAVMLDPTSEVRLLMGQQHALAYRLSTVLRELDQRDGLDGRPLHLASWLAHHARKYVPRAPLKTCR